MSLKQTTQVRYECPRASRSGEAARLLLLMLSNLSKLWQLLPIDPNLPINRPLAYTASRFQSRTDATLVSDPVTWFSAHVDGPPRDRNVLGLSAQQPSDMSVKHLEVQFVDKCVLGIAR
jgi:hypothetical protein